MLTSESFKTVSSWVCAVVSSLFPLEVFCFAYSLEALLEVLTRPFLSREQPLVHRPADADGEEDTVAEGASTCDGTDP